MEVQDSIIDFNKICRLCLMEESVMSSIYNETDKHSSAVPLPLRIMACVSIELNSIDGLPSQICTTCLCQVDGWYKFKDLCESSDALLRKCVKNEPVQLEMISEIRSRAKEVRQFFASPHLVKVDGLESALNHQKAANKPMEIAIRKDDERVIQPNEKRVMRMSPHAYLKRLLSEYKLSDGVTLKEIQAPEGRENCEKKTPDYEIAFDSHIERPVIKSQSERLVMEMGDWQLLEVGQAVRESSGRRTEDRVENAVANYEKTKEYLEKAVMERGNAHEEVIENVLYTFRLDEDNKVDVVNIVEGVSEGHSQRGFRYACPFCSKIVLNKMVYDRHVREQHLNFLVCKVCDKQLYSLRNFLIHTKTHLGVYTFTCPVCGKGLTRASIFKTHMQYHYYGKVQKCKICEKKFRDVFALRRHVQLHDKKIEYVCELCGYGTHLKSNLECHVRAAHGSENSFMCEVCGKTFAAIQNLQSHLKTHEPNFPCPHCKRAFRHEEKFRNHLKYNHSEFPVAEKETETETETFNEEEFGEEEQIYEISFVDECFL